MIDHLARLLSIPSSYSSFALRGGREGVLAYYVLDSQADWPERSFVSAGLRKWPRQATKLNAIDGLDQIPFNGEEHRAAFCMMRDVLAGRLRLTGASDRCSVSEVCETSNDGSRSLSFAVHVTGHPLYGSFTDVRRLHLCFNRADPFAIEVRTVARGFHATPPSCVGDLDCAVDFDVDGLFECAEDDGSNVSPAFLRMETQGIPVQELSPSLVSELCRDLRNTLPDTRIVGHLVTRSNIVLWSCLERPETAVMWNLMGWCDEIARLSLDLPDDLFRHFLSASILARTALSLGMAPRTPEPVEVECCARYAALLPRFPAPTQGELSTLVLWMFGALESSADIGLIRSVSNAISVVDGDGLSILTAVDTALDQAHSFAKGRPDDEISALLGIRRAELAASILQAAASKGRVDAQGSAFHHVMFGKLHQYAFYHQGKLYGLEDRGINEGLVRAAGGSPPGILFLRPLSTLRALYVASPHLGAAKQRLLTFEAALADALQPLGQAMNAVGGLADIRGMQRSDFAGTGEEWQILVMAMMETAGVIFVLPDVSEGVTWEIETLGVKNQLARTIFILLPTALDWSDGGNRRSFECIWGLQDQSLDPAGGFYVAHPANGEKLPWESLWTGELAKRVSDILVRSAP